MMRLGLGLVALFVVARTLGLDRGVGVLSGTVPGTMAEALAGLAFAALWFAAVLLAVPLMVAGLVGRPRQR